MKPLKIIPLLFVFFGIFPLTSCSNSETKDLRNDKVFVSDKKEPEIESKDATNYKILSNNSKTLSISNVEYYIKQGDEFIKNGDFDQAKNSYLDARKLAKQLALFYSDLNSSFKGIDARIPIEMVRKGKETLKIQAKTNGRLASLYLKTEKPEVAVPLLIETIRIMSPNSPEGKDAYEKLLQLGFVETKYKG